VSQLDVLFESLYRDFDAPIVEKSVEIIIKRKGDIYLNELAEVLNISRRTILRNFKAHLNCSFQDFKNVVKFRKAIEHNNQKSTYNKLSDLAYDLNYYDQSDLIKTFKSMTNETPKRMLAAISPLSNKLIWKHVAE
jgi:AraC-like DNA-binding protein